MIPISTIMPASGLLNLTRRACYSHHPQRFHCRGHRVGKKYGIRPVPRCPQTLEHDLAWTGIVISSGFENAPFTLGPRDCQGPRLPHPADAEIAVVQKLRLDAPFAVIPQLARPGVMLSRSAQFPEGFSGPGTTRGVTVRPGV